MMKAFTMVPPIPLPKIIQLHPENKKKEHETDVFIKFYQILLRLNPVVQFLTNTDAPFFLSPFFQPRLLDFLNVGSLSKLSFPHLQPLPIKNQ